MRTVAIVQARLGSSRLPGKVLLDLCGKSVLYHCVERVQRCNRVDEVVIATTDKHSDDRLVAEAERIGVRVFRGSEEDVLDRYFGAAVAFGAEVVVRVTSDCPLFDPDVLTGMMARFEDVHASGTRLDYLSNCLQRTFPRGLDAELFTMEALTKAHAEAQHTYEREHVTPYIYGHPELFQLENFAQETDWSAYRWTLDTAEDYQMISTMYHELYPASSRFSSADVIGLLGRKPEIAAINAHVQQKNLGA